MRLHLLITFSLLGLSVADTHLRVLHRLYNPVTGASSAFAERGTLTSSESVTAAWVFNPSPKDWKRYPELFHDLDLGQALYQVALERPSDVNEAHWAISSVKACHLPESISDTLVVHVTDTLEPFAIDYFVVPIPHDGACPKSSISGLFRNGIHNTTVVTRFPSPPPLPILRAPPPLSPEGAPVQPIPQKSFIQNYWMYIAAILVVFMLTGDPGEEPQRSSGD